MSLTIVRLTHFQVERLRCIGGQGRSTPYRITTFHDAEIGILGKVMEPTTQAGNASMYDKTGWQGLKRLLTTFRR
jgi:hypothetical protein